MSTVSDRHISIYRSIHEATPERFLKCDIQTEEFHSWPSDREITRVSAPNNVRTCPFVVGKITESIISVIGGSDGKDHLKDWSNSPE